MPNRWCWDSGPKSVTVGAGEIPGEIRVVEDLGSEVFVHVAVQHRGEPVSIVAKVPAPFGGRPGEPVQIGVRGAVHVFDADRAAPGDIGRGRAARARMSNGVAFVTGAAGDIGRATSVGSPNGAGRSRRPTTRRPRPTWRRPSRPAHRSARPPGRRPFDVTDTERSPSPSQRCRAELGPPRGAVQQRRRAGIVRPRRSLLDERGPHRSSTSTCSARSPCCRSSPMRW